MRAAHLNNVPSSARNTPTGQLISLFAVNLVALVRLAFELTFSRARGPQIERRVHSSNECLPIGSVGLAVCKLARPNARAKEWASCSVESAGGQSASSLVND